MKKETIFWQKETVPMEKETIFSRKETVPIQKKKGDISKNENNRLNK